jgi:hypothetical protein
MRGKGGVIPAALVVPRTSWVRKSVERWNGKNVSRRRRGWPFEWYTHDIKRWSHGEVYSYNVIPDWQWL